MTDHDDDFEPHHRSSSTDQVLQELQLYGYRAFQDEPDPRPLPGAQILAGSIADIFDAIVVALSDTRLEPDLESEPPRLPCDGHRRSVASPTRHHNGVPPLNRTPELAIDEAGLGRWCTGAGSCACPPRPAAPTRWC